MNDIFEYIEEYKNFKFSQMGVTEIDNAIFSRLAYLDFTPFAGKTIGEISEEYPFSENEKKTMEQTQELLKALSNTKRYEYITVCDASEIFDEDSANAFYAVTFEIQNDLFFIAFRGTDDTIASYYEDAELAYTFPIRSQTAALSYVSTALFNRVGKFYLGGHSKGGNLALFAFLFLREDEKDRIIRVYNNDGPGFPEEISAVIFTHSTRDKIISILPEDSIIGRMLTLGGKIKIVKSDALPTSQHNMFTWEINGAEFADGKKFSLLSEYMEDSLSESLENLPPEKIKRVTETIFSIAKNSGIKSLKDINIKNYKGIVTALIEFSKRSDEESDEQSEIIRTLVRSLINSISIEKMISYSFPNLANVLTEIQTRTEDRISELSEKLDKLKNE